VLVNGTQSRADVECDRDRHGGRAVVAIGEPGLCQYGIGVSEPTLDYSRMLRRVREVVGDVRTRSPHLAAWMP